MKCIEFCLQSRQSFCSYAAQLPSIARLTGHWPVMAFRDLLVTVRQWTHDLQPLGWLATDVESDIFSVMQVVVMSKVVFVGGRLVTSGACQQMTGLTGSVGHCNSLSQGKSSASFLDGNLTGRNIMTSVIKSIESWIH